MITKFHYFLRYLKFQLIYKRRFSKTPGIPCLCPNINHPYHESKFERDTCEMLCSIIGPKEVLVPTQHNYHIKFDFVIKKTAIIEPHGIWSDRPGEGNFFDYYKQRREYADKEDELKEIPVVVLSNSSDLNYLKKELKGSTNYKKACQEVIINLLEKYKTTELPLKEEQVLGVSNIWIILFLIISLVLNFYFIFLK